MSKYVWMCVGIMLCVFYINSSSDSIGLHIGILDTRSVFLTLIMCVTYIILKTLLAKIYYVFIT